MTYHRRPGRTKNTDIPVSSARRATLVDSECDAEFRSRLARSGGFFDREAAARYALSLKVEKPNAASRSLPHHSSDY